MENMGNRIRQKEDKEMRKVLDFMIVIVSLVAAFFVFTGFNMEGIVKKMNQPEAVSSQELEEDPGTVFVGRPAGEGIPEVRGQAEWEDVLNDVDDVKVIPKSIQKTNVYSLAEWADPFKRRRNGAVGKQKASVKQAPFDISLDYVPYYMLELEDGSHILAQVSQSTAKDIKKGNLDALPIGRKQGFSQNAKSLLEPVCAEYNASTDYIWYAIDNEWQKNHSFEILIGKAVVAVVFFFALAVILELLADKIFGKEKQRQEQ